MFLDLEVLGNSDMHLVNAVHFTSHYHYQKLAANHIKWIYCCQSTHNIIKYSHAWHMTSHWLAYKINNKLNFAFVQYINCGAGVTNQAATTQFWTIDFKSCFAYDHQIAAQKKECNAHKQRRRYACRTTSKYDKASSWIIVEVLKVSTIWITIFLTKTEPLRTIVLGLELILETEFRPWTTTNLCNEPPDCSATIREERTCLSRSTVAAIQSPVRSPMDITC